MGQQGPAQHQSKSAITAAALLHLWLPFPGGTLQLTALVQAVTPGEGPEARLLSLQQVRAVLV